MKLEFFSRWPTSNAMVKNSRLFTQSNAASLELAAPFIVLMGINTCYTYLIIAVVDESIERQRRITLQIVNNNRKQCIVRIWFCTLTSSARAEAR